MNNASDIGQGRKYQDATQKQQPYVDPLANLPTERRIPTLPKAPDPAPYKITGSAGGM